MNLRRYSYLIPVLFLLIFSGCENEKHLISDHEYRARIAEQLNIRKISFYQRDTSVFEILNRPLDIPQKEALEFLYAYMPLNDLVDYNGDFFLEQVNMALKARKTFRWGKHIPEDIFLHFVLPSRVNNENLDNARIVFF